MLPSGLDKALPVKHEPWPFFMKQEPPILRNWSGHSISLSGKYGGFVRPIAV